MDQRLIKQKLHSISELIIPFIGNIKYFNLIERIVGFNLLNLVHHSFIEKQNEEEKEINNNNNNNTNNFKNFDFIISDFFDDVYNYNYNYNKIMNNQENSIKSLKRNSSINFRDLSPVLLKKLMEENNKIEIFDKFSPKTKCSLWNRYPELINNEVSFFKK